MNNAATSQDISDLLGTYRNTRDGRTARFAVWDSANVKLQLDDLRGREINQLVLTRYEAQQMLDELRDSGWRKEAQ